LARGHGTELRARVGDLIPLRTHATRIAERQRGLGLAVDSDGEPYLGALYRAGPARLRTVQATEAWAGPDVLCSVLVELHSTSQCRRLRPVPNQCHFKRDVHLCRDTVKSHRPW
jgi:hypothetical protein